MSNKHKHIAFLCGHFKRDKAVDFIQLEKAGWQRIAYTEDKRKKASQFYYPDFVGFCYAESMEDGCVKYSLQVDNTLSTLIRGKKGQERILPPFLIKEIVLYFMPQQMVLYSIQIEQEVKEFDDCSHLMFALRLADGFNWITRSTFRPVAIDPIVEVYNSVKVEGLQGDYSRLVENGNKLRLFQIIHAADGSLTDEYEKRRQLYRLATFVPAASSSDYKEGSLFDEYQRKEIERNCVAVFPDWVALAMLDTFTILASNSEGETDNWVERYFGMIYIHAMFQKTCLFDFNNRFKQVLNDYSKRESALSNKGCGSNKSVSLLEKMIAGFKRIFIDDSRKEITSLVSEYEEFERRCCFNKISYNFLPLLLDEAISNSLEIEDEMKQLYRVMDKERKRNGEASRRKMNTLLIFISFLTIFSAIWGACSMLNAMFCFTAHFGSSFMGFRWVGGGISLVVIIVLAFLYLRKRKF